MIWILFLMAMSFSCNTDQKTDKSPKPKKLPFVKIEAAKATKMVSYIEITGTIEANIFTDIKSPADGIIESLLARENQQVVKDRIIAVINPSDRVALISNNLLQVQQIEERLNATNKDSDEYKLILQELEKAKENLEYSKKMYRTVPVICPMNGLVTERWLDKGNQVAEKDKILTISDMSSLVIKAEVNEKYIQAVKQGKKLPVILNAYPEDTLKGTISLVYPKVDPTTRSIKFDIKILNFNKKLLPGMMASIKIPVLTKENVVAVPEHAVLTSPDYKNFLFVINKDSLALKRIIQTGISSENNLEIIEGLKEKEKVVIAGQEMLKDSIKVKIIETAKKLVK